MNPSKFQRYEAFAYRSIYAEPVADSFHNQLIELLVAKFLPQFQLPQDAFIIDLGCGQGKFMEEAAARGYRNVLGVTLSSEDHAACLKKGHQALLQDFSDLELADESVALIWARHCLEHSPYPLFSLLEFNRLLKVGGLAYIEMPAPDNERPHETNPNHFSILGTRMWMALFQRSEFECVHSQDIDFAVDQNGQRFSEKYLVFVLRKLRPVSYPAPH